jgi:hypothetical protein
MCNVSLYKLFIYVEDEIHFLLKCEALQNVRTPFIDLIKNNNYNFKHLHDLDIREQFIWFADLLCPEQKREPCYFMFFRINVAIE